MIGENYEAARTLDIEAFAKQLQEIRADLTELYDAQHGEWFGSAEGRAVFDAFDECRGRRL